MAPAELSGSLTPRPLPRHATFVVMPARLRSCPGQTVRQSHVGVAHSRLPRIDDGRDASPRTRYLSASEPAGI